MTLKSISEQLNITKEQAKQIKDLINHKSDPVRFNSVQKWVSQCYTQPSHDEMVQEALNEILETYGTEALFTEEYSCYHPLFAYCNAGDAYNTTIIYLDKEDKYIISCWGDVMEYYERKGYHFD